MFLWEGVGPTPGHSCISVTVCVVGSGICHLPTQLSLVACGEGQEHVVSRRIPLLC